MGRRIGAWIIDLLPAIDPRWSSSRGHRRRTYTNVARGFCDSADRSPSGHFCFQSGHTAYASRFGRRGHSSCNSAGTGSRTSGLLQGATGATLGKRPSGCASSTRRQPLRDGQGHHPHASSAYFELGFCFLIGLITALVSKNHRRLGDMAAGTFVVRRGVGRASRSPAPRRAGTRRRATRRRGARRRRRPGPGRRLPPASSSGAAPADAPGWVTPPPATGPPRGRRVGPPPVAITRRWAPGATPAPRNRRCRAGRGADPRTPNRPRPPARAIPRRRAGAAPAALGVRAAGAATGGGPGWSRPPPPTATRAAVGPQRNAWVYWEAETNRWLQFDPTTNQWGPLRLTARGCERRRVERRLASPANEDR